MSRLSCDENDAEDCAQETFLVYYKRLKQGETFDNPRAFLYQTAYHFIKRRQRERNDSLNRHAPLDESRAYQTDTAEWLDAKLDFQNFEILLNDLLTQEEKELYRLRFAEEKSIDEIAKILQINKKYCTVKISRLRQKIRKNLNSFSKKGDD